MDMALSLYIIGLNWSELKYWDCDLMFTPVTHSERICKEDVGIGW